MTQMLSLSRAARLAGVSRGELQATVRRLALPTFEGGISVDTLIKAYPEVELDRDPVLERMRVIKAKARPKRKYTDHWLPEPEVLMSRLEDFQDVLVRTKSALNTAQQLLGELAGRLEAAAGADEAQLRATIVDLSRKLRQTLAETERHTDREAELFAKDALLRIVSASVRLLPSGHEFFVEGSDSLLAAAMKSGLHLDYGCSSGNCGSCKVRVAAGRVRRIREHDYVLSAQEQQQGYILACSNTALTDVVLEANEALTASDLPPQEIRSRLRRREPAGPGLTLVRVQTPRTQSLRFMAGQRVTLTTEDGHSREMPVASCPCDARNLEFLVRDIPGDGFSGTLLNGPGDQTLLVRGPQGEFLLEEEDTGPALFIAAGDGFASIKSLVEHAIAIDNAARLHLYRLHAPSPDNPLDNQCRAWDDALDNFRYRPLDPDTPPKTLLDVLARDFPKLGECRIYLAGPGEWVRQFRTEAAGRGIPEEYLRSDVER